MKGRWTLRDLVDFEGLTADARTPDDGAVLESVKGLEGAEARRVGMKVWLDGVRRDGGDFSGEVWASGRFVVGALVVVVMFLTGIGVMAGMLDRERMAFHVPMVLGVSVGLPLLILIASWAGWLFRGRFSKGLGFVPRLLGGLVGKLAGTWKMDGWRTLRLEGGKGWEALGWNLVRLTQAGAVMLSAGLMVGLLGCILFMEVGFYWESTTPGWMAARLFTVSSYLSLPWGWLFPQWVPGITEIWLTQFEPDRGNDWRVESAERWYPFVFASIFCWGMLPRLLFWGYAIFRERRALAALDFQSKRHRELWREIMGTRRADVSEAPLDGVLVVDVGGTGLKENELRGFLLRRMRVNPGEWFEVGVWDGKGEAAVAESIRKAPAGVVLLAEGWALSPPRMTALCRQIRSLAKAATPIYFLVVNVGSDGKLAEVKQEEKTVWKDFADGLADAALEVFFHEGEGGP